MANVLNYRLARRIQQLFRCPLETFQGSKLLSSGKVSRLGSKTDHFKRMREESTCLITVIGNIFIVYPGFPNTARSLLTIKTVTAPACLISC